jgi:hypothetical protein
LPPEGVTKALERAEGFEPSTFIWEGCHKPQESPEKREICATAAPRLRKIDPDLAEIERLWGRLPEAVKAGIVAMVKAAGGQ